MAERGAPAFLAAALTFPSSSGVNQVVAGRVRRVSVTGGSSRRPRRRRLRRRGRRWRCRGLPSGRPGRTSAKMAGGGLAPPAVWPQFRRQTASPVVGRRGRDSPLFPVRTGRSFTPPRYNGETGLIRGVKAAPRAAGKVPVRAGRHIGRCIALSVFRRFCPAMPM